MQKIFSDRGVSGAKAERPGLDKALEHIRKKDVLVIWKLDRLGRSLSDLLSTVEYLKERGAHFLSIQDGFDTSTASGKMVFSVIGTMAEYERNLIRERTMAGLKAALLVSTFLEDWIFGDCNLVSTTLSDYGLILQESGPYPKIVLKYVF